MDPNIIIPSSDIKSDRRKVIGQGGFGIIYRAEYVGAPVALKELKHGLASEEENEELNRECCIHATLRHPNIVLLLGIVTDAAEGAPPAMVLELLDQSLHGYLHSEEVFSWSERVRVAREIAQGLAFLHSKGILHRDLKSRNVLLTKDRTAKLCDFGLALIKSSASTRAGDSMAGTPAWMAPETLSRQPPEYSEQSDIFSFGMTLWEVASRADPFDRCRPVQIIAFITSGKRETIPEDCPDFFKKLIECCWSDSPAERMPLLTVIEHLSANLRVEDVHAEASLSPFSHAVVDPFETIRRPPQEVLTDTSALQNVFMLLQRDPDLRRFFQPHEDISFIVKILKGHENNVDLVVVACDLLGLLVKTGFQQCANYASEEVRNANGIEAIIGAMKLHPGSSDVQEKACAALCHLSSDTENRIRIVHVGGVGAVIAAMKSFQTNLFLQESGSETMSQVASRGYDNQKHIADSGGMDATLMAMKTHPNDPIIQQSGCSTVFALSQRLEFQDRIVENGGMELAIDAVRNHVDSEAVQSIACAAVSSLISQPERIPKFLEAGGLEAVVTAMKTHISSETVQEYGCTNLAHVARVNVDCVMEGGGSGVVMAAMKTLAANETVQEDGCSVLFNVLQRKDFHDRIVGQGGMELVIDAMNNHGASEALQEMACGALSMMIEQEDLVPQFVTSGGLKAVANAMKVHTTNESLQKFGCLNVSRVARTDVDSVVDSGGADAVIAAMKTLPMNGAVQEDGCSILFALSQQKEHQGYMVDRGGMEIVIDAMKNHSNSEALQEKACGTLSKLTEQEDRVPQFVAAGGVKVVANAMKAHLSNESLQRFGCVNMNHVACVDADSVVRDGGSDATIAAMKTHPRSAAVLSSGCTVLANLAINNVAVQELILEKGGIEVVIESMKLHVNDACLQENACAALVNLCESSSRAKQRIGEVGGVECALSALTRYKENNDLQEKAGSILKNAVIPDFEKVTDWESVCSLMKTHGEVEPVQEWGCKAIAGLAGSPASRQELEGPGVILVLTAMKTHLPSAAIQQQGCCALCSLFEGSAQAKDCFKKEDGMGTVWDILLAHLKSEEVHRHCCRALGFLGGGDRAQAYEAVMAVLAAMTTHTGEGVQGCGCWALGELLVDVQDILDGFDIKRACRVVLQAMEWHVESVSSQVQGCKTIAIMARNAKVRVKLDGPRCIDSVLAAFEAHPRSELVSEHGAECLRHLAVVGRQCVHVMPSKVVALIAQRMECFLNNPMLQEHSLVVLRYHPSLLSEMQNVVLSSVFSAMRAYPDNETIQECGCAILAHAGERVEAFLTSNRRAADVFKQARERFPQNQLIQSKARQLQKLVEGECLIM